MPGFKVNLRPQVQTKEKEKRKQEVGPTRVGNPRIKVWEIRHTLRPRQTGVKAFSENTNAGREGQGFVKSQVFIKE